MSKTETTTTKSEPVKFGTAVAAPTKPQLAPKHVTLNDAGHAYRNIVVRMPQGMVADDLRDPKIWKLVQQTSHSALLKYDHLLLLTFDEGQAIRAMVTHATADEVHLMIESVKTFRAVGQDQFYNNGVLEIHWTGNGYGVRTIATGQPIDGQSHSSLTAAIDSLHRHAATKAA